MALYCSEMNPSSITFEAVLVDMDGTLVDSNRLVEDSWRVVCDRFGLNLEELLVFSHGRLAITTLQKYLPHLSDQEHADLVAGMLKHEEDTSHLVTPIPGALQFIECAQQAGAPWALVTSAIASLARKRFHYAGLPWPEVAVTAELVEDGKPAPDGYLSAARTLGADPARSLVFEDAPPGIMAGLNAGAQVIGVNPEPVDISEYITPDTPGTYLGQVPTMEGLCVERAGEDNGKPLFRLVVGN